MYQRFDNTRQQVINSRLDSLIAEGKMLGGGVAGIAGSDSYQFVSGFTDIAKTKPFTGKTIIRQASDGKPMSTIAFLKLVQDGLITGWEDLAVYFPAFANTKVINPYMVDGQIFTNIIWATSGSSILQVRQIGHGLASGDFIGIKGAGPVQGIVAAQINKIHIVTVLDANTYTITVTSLAAGTSTVGEGGVITITKLTSSVKQTALQGVTYYYTELPLSRPIKTMDIMEHTLGYLYREIFLSTTFGYADGSTDAVKVQKRNIQAALLSEKLLPAGRPDKPLPLSSGTLADWANTLAAVPLLFQPGAEVSYGPQLNLLGALIEKLTGKTLENYFKDEITGPLKMTDTGFFIQNDDPTRAEKLSRIQPLYLSFAPNSFIDINNVVVGPDGLPFGYGDYFFGTDQPKKLALIAGGMYSTLEDRSKFYRMLLNDGRTPDGKILISPAIISLLSQNHIKDYPMWTPLYAPSTQFRWGLGVGVQNGTNDQETLSLTGQTRSGIFWSGAFGTAFTVDYANDTSYNFVMNTAYAYPLTAPKTLLAATHMSALIVLNPKSGKNVDARLKQKSGWW